VTDRDDAWKSNTFRQNRQENLLIADKQTEIFDRSDPDGRAALTRLAWGDYTLSKVHGELFR
jgi:hypothetical protein